MAGIRIVPAIEADTLIRGVVPRFTRDRLVVKKKAGDDIVRITLSANEELAMRDQLLLRHPLPVPVPAPAPVPTPTPVPAPTPAPSKPLLGLDGRPDWPERLTPVLRQMAPAVRIVRLSTERLGFGTTKTDQTLAAVRAVGAEPLVMLANWPTASTDARRWFGRYGIRRFEIGNETFYNYGDKSTTLALAKSNARLYAAVVKATKQALVGTDAHVIAQADFPHWGGAEIAEIKAAAPDLALFIDGVTIHPYVNATARIATMYEQLASLGISAEIPVWVTEIGLATANGRRLDANISNGTIYGRPRDLNYDRAAALVPQMAAETNAAVHNLACLCWYEDIDQVDATSTSTDEEARFGVFHRDATPKGAFTQAVRALGQG